MPWLASAFAGALLELGAASPVSLPSTLVTEGALPATEVEAVVQASRSSTERTYELALSAQYAPAPWLGFKLVVPIDGNASRDEDAQGGIGDISLVAKYAALILPAHQLAAAGGLKLTLPTGDRERGLGGEFAFGLFLAAGKTFGPFSMQADASYGWQLNRPPMIDAAREGEERRLAHREHGASANLAATVSATAWLGFILELNTVMKVGGENDDGLKERVQLYLTPGLGVEPAPGWNVRGGVQLPLTSAKQFDYNIVVILTKSF